jgi:hypothetical protein
LENAIREALNKPGRTEGMRKIAERWSVPGGRPKVSNCKLSGPMATSAAAGARQILKTGLIVAWLGLVGVSIPRQSRGL